MSRYQPTVRKVTAIVPMSFEQLLSVGAITEEQALEQGWVPPTPPTRRERWRWARQEWWHQHRPHLHLGPCDEGGDW